MTKPLIVDSYSVATLPLEMLFGSTSLSTGTSFIWELGGGDQFLVTNWHNLSGINPLTGENLSPTGGRPDRITVYMPAKGNAFERILFQKIIRDDNDSPQWWIHPEFGKSVDIAAIPITLPDPIDVLPINKLSDQDLSVEVGNDVYILGFPFGIATGGLPIWKRASVASEPALAINGQCMLVDTASRPGMSGSPVLRRSWGTHLYANGSAATGVGSETSFVGIYSGRLTTNHPLDAQLGLVWPTKLIIDILQSGHRDL